MCICMNIARFCTALLLQISNHLNFFIHLISCCYCYCCLAFKDWCIMLRINFCFIYCFPRFHYKLCSVLVFHFLLRLRDSHDLLRRARIYTTIIGREIRAQRLKITAATIKDVRSQREMKCEWEMKTKSATTEDASIDESEECFVHCAKWEIEGEWA